MTTRREREAAARALREAADELAEGLADLPDSTVGLSYRNCSSIDVSYLRDRADRIERTQP